MKLETGKLVMLDVCVGVDKWTKEIAVKVTDGVFGLYNLPRNKRAGDSVLVEYEPADQFASVVE